MESVVIFECMPQKQGLVLPITLAFSRKIADLFNRPGTLPVPPGKENRADVFEGPVESAHEAQVLVP
jgi:hypothetical protein